MIETARQIVLDVWTEQGFDPHVYREAIADVLAGKWDHKVPVQIALKALSNERK